MTFLNKTQNFLAEKDQAFPLLLILLNVHALSLEELPQSQQVSLYYFYNHISKSSGQEGAVAALQVVLNEGFLECPAEEQAFDFLVFDEENRDVGQSLEHFFLWEQNETFQEGLHDPLLVVVQFAQKQENFLRWTSFGIKEKVLNFALEVGDRLDFLLLFPHLLLATVFLLLLNF